MAEPLGRIRASNQPIQAPRPRIDPDAFGAGIASAIRGLGQNLAEFDMSQEQILDAEEQLALAHQARTNRRVRADAQVGIIRAQTQLSMDVEEMRRTMPADGSGFTEAVHELVTEQVAAIRGNIPAELLPEFEDNLARMVSSFSLSAFETELTAGDAAYQSAVSDLMQQAQNEIVLSDGDPTVLAEWQGRMESLLATSPLDVAVTEALTEQVNATFAVLAYTREARDAVQDPMLDQGALPGGVDGRDVAATNLPGPIRGMLNAGSGEFTSPSPNVQIDINPGTGRPTQALLNILSHTVEQIFGAGSRIAISSGHEGRASGTRRHPAGTAADFNIILPDGTTLGYMDPQQQNIVQEFMMQAARNGIHGIGYGRNYMGGTFHMDVFPPEQYAGESHLWEEATLVPGLLQIMQQYQPGTGAGTYQNRANVNPITGQVLEDTFEGFTEHPGGVAGRYSLDQSAWDEARQALGLADFSPASQDRAAWWLAERYYTESSGRSLQADLASGDPTKIENVRQALIEADGFQLPGIESMSREDFYNQVTMSDSTLPGVMYDERFQDIPIGERITIFSDQQGAFQDQIIARQQAADAGRATFLENLNANIQLGTAGQNEIIQAQREFNLTPPEMLELVNNFNRVNAGRQELARFSATMADPDSFVDMSSDGQRGLYNQYSQERHMPIIEERDLDGFQQSVVRDVSRTGRVSAPVVQELRRLSRSVNPDDRDFAFAALAGLMERDPVAFDAAFGSQMMAATRMAALAGSYMNEEQRSARLTQMLGPLGEETESLANSALRTAQTDNPEWFSPSSIMSEISRADSIDQPRGAALQAEFTELMREGFRAGMAPEDAQQFATDALETRWGESAIGGGDSYLMRRPPEKYLTESPVSGYGWVETQVQQELGIPEGRPFRLVSTPQTEADIEAGRSPAYGVMVEDDFGAWISLMAEPDPMGRNPGPARPTQIRFDNTQVQEDITNTLVRQNADFRASNMLGNRLQQAQAQITVFGSIRPNTMQELQRTVNTLLEANPGAVDLVLTRLRQAGITDNAVIDEIMGDD